VKTANLSAVNDVPDGGIFAPQRTRPAQKSKALTCRAGSFVEQKIPPSGVLQEVEIIPAHDESSTHHKQNDVKHH
jgi:hypothetical protein